MLIQVPNLNCRINHLERETKTDQVMIFNNIVPNSVLSSQVKLVLTLKTVKEKLVREKVQVGGESLTTINLEVTQRIAKCCRYDKCSINLIKMAVKISTLGYKKVPCRLWRECWARERARRCSGGFTQSL